MKRLEEFLPSLFRGLRLSRFFGYQRWPPFVGRAGSECEVECAFIFHAARNSGLFFASDSGRLESVGGPRIDNANTPSMHFTKG